MQDSAKQQKMIYIGMGIVLLLVIMMVIFRPKTTIAPTADTPSSEQKTTGTEVPYPATNPYVATFVSTVDATSSSMRRVTLVNDEDGTATFTQEALNSEKALVQKGTWEGNTTGTLKVVLTEENGKVMTEPEILSFEYKPSNAGFIVLSFPELTDWDETGLTMQNVAPFDSKTWVWQKSLFSDDTEITPKTAGVFQLIFLKDGTVNVATDCNSGSSSYYLMSANMLKFDQFVLTKKMCEGSQENEFLQQLSKVTSYITRDGKLYLLFDYDSGSMEFTQQVE